MGAHQLIEKGTPTTNALILYRFSRACLRLPVVPRIIDSINTAVTGCKVPGEATIGVGTELIEGGKGVRISRRAIIGNHVRIAPYVRIGGDVIIEDHAVIGAGCHIIGPITVKRGQLVHLSMLSIR